MEIRDSKSIIPIQPQLMSLLMEAFGREWIKPLDNIPEDIPLSEVIAYRRGIKVVLDWLNDGYTKTHGSPYLEEEPLIHHHRRLLRHRHRLLSAQRIV